MNRHGRDTSARAKAYRAPAGPTSDSLIAFSIDDGTIKWVRQFVANDVYQLGSLLGPDYDVGTAPNLFVASGRRMVGAGGKDGTYRAFDRDTGAPIWNTPVGRVSIMGGVMHSPASGDGRIYIVSNTSIVSLGGGSGRNTSVPATATAYAFDAATGTPVWTRQLDAGGFGGIAYANGLMYASAWDGRMRVFNATNGTIVKEVQVSPQRGTFVPDAFPNGSASAPVIYGNRVLMGYGWAWAPSSTGGVTTMEADVSGGGPGSTVRLASTADTYVQSGTPTINYSTNVNLLVRRADREGLTRASYLQFPLTGIPEGTITSATLRLYGRHDAPTGTGQSVSAWGGTLNTTWAGTTVNYNNSTTVTGINFYETTSIATTTVGITPQFHEWNVTDYVNQRRSLGHATFGLAADSEHLYRVTFNSTNSSTNRPELVVTVNGVDALANVVPARGKSN